VSVQFDHRADTLSVVHEINVTLPFIDVILVRLIIFVIAAPLATVDVAIDLPANNAQRQQGPEQPIFLTVKSDLTLALGDAPISKSQLQSALDAASKGARSQRVFLRADKSIVYSSLMDTMNALRSAEYLKIALVGLTGGG
jgi:biopolymer transport protein ExbD